MSEMSESAKLAALVPQAIEPEELTSVEQVREVIAATPGYDTSRKNQLYQRELQILAGQQSGRGAVVPGQQVNAEAAIEGLYDSLYESCTEEEVADLRNTFAGAELENFLLALSLNQYMRDETVALVEEHGIPETTVLVALAKIARCLGFTWIPPGRAPASNRSASMESTSAPAEPGSEQAIKQALRENRQALQVARGEGDYREIERINAEELRLSGLLARARGQPSQIVGSGGRYS